MPAYTQRKGDQKACLRDSFSRTVPEEKENASCVFLACLSMLVASLGWSGSLP